MAEISQTILKKIGTCAVMVADVTPIATKGDKSLPNPNVMVELGYAMSSIGFDRIIAIMNTANGDKIETLPFDIRHRRILTYALTTDATKTQRNTAKKDLIQKLVDAIRTNVSKVRSERLSLEWKVDSKCSEDLTALERLEYIYRIDEFVGRENEIDLLWRFAENSSSRGLKPTFRWMLLTGDAGEGKSRLAYEFTKKLGDKWCKGKLDFDRLKAFENPSEWRPVKPTFIVIDNVQSVPEEVQGLLSAFSTQEAKFKFPVRLLLLERSANASWTDKLVPERRGNSEIKQHNFNKYNFDEQKITGYKISPLSPGSITELMQDVFRMN